MRLLLAVAVLLCLGAPPGLAAHAPGGPTPASGQLSCGSLAPFNDTCDDCCLHLGAGWTIGLGVEGYVGGLDVAVRGEEGAEVWHCWSFGSAAVSGCTGPVVEGNGLGRREEVALHCDAVLSTGPGLPVAVGAFGPWGCSLNVP